MNNGQDALLNYHTMFRYNGFIIKRTQYFQPLLILIVFQTFEKCFVTRPEGMCGARWIHHHMHIFDFHQLYEVGILDMVTVAIQQEELGFGAAAR